MTDAALQDVHVLELGSDVATAYATRLLTDVGADTVKVEPPSGDPLRHGEGVTSGDAATAQAMFDYLNANKRSVVVNHELDGDRAALERLFAWADIVVERLGHGGLEALGLDAATRRDLNPSAVVVRITDWGLKAAKPSRPATGLTLQAAAGWVVSRNDPGSPVVAVGGGMHDYVIASYAATAALTGHAAAVQSGQGGEVDVSAHACLHSTLPYQRLFLDTLTELGWGSPSNQRTPFGIRPCRDGWIGINILTGQQWVDACTVTGLVEYVDLQQELMRGEADLAAFRARLNDWLSQRTVSEVVEVCQAFRIPTVPVGAGDRLTDFVQWQARPFFQRVEGSAGSFTRPGFPWRFSRSSLREPERGPTLGEHSETLLELSTSTTEGSS